jgi:hypothetical protein
MQHTRTIPRSAGAAVRSWVIEGLWRGAAVGAATPIVGFALVWFLGWVDPEPLPPGTITSSSLDDASFGEALAQLGGLALYGSIAAGVGAAVGALSGALLGLVAAGGDSLAGRRVHPGPVAAVVVLACAAGASWATWVVVDLDADAERDLRLVVLVPFVLGLWSLAALPLRRGSATEASEEHLHQPPAVRRM